MLGKCCRHRARDCAETAGVRLPCHHERAIIGSATNSISRRRRRSTQPAKVREYYGYLATFLAKHWRIFVVSTCSFVEADMSLSEDIVQLMTAITCISGGVLDVLVNNAGNAKQTLVRVVTLAERLIVFNDIRMATRHTGIWVRRMDG
jgi:NAD(P)-dependent dehydrogenase (short-subunit alcohol dehydrogenase family)